MLFIPPRRWGLLVGALLILITLLLDAFWVWQIIRWPITFLSFVQSALVILSLPWLGLLIYWLYGLATLRYHLDRNRLYIRWGVEKRVIPLPEIGRVTLGGRLVSPLQYRGAWWPGYRAGRGNVRAVGQTAFYATTSLDRMLFLETPASIAAISPPDPEIFLQELERRREIGPTRQLEPSTRRPAFFRWAFWKDRVALGLLGLGALTLAALFGRLCWGYASLPQRLALHFDAQGQVDRIGRRSDLFALPIVGLIVLAVNLVLGLLLYRRERTGAYLLWGSAIAVHALLWLALGQLMV
jgi:hypothetical protein